MDNLSNEAIEHTIKILYYQINEALAKGKDCDFNQLGLFYSKIHALKLYLKVNSDQEKYSKHELDDKQLIAYKNIGISDYYETCGYPMNNC